MKEMSVYKAEVFRRSNERIAVRRRIRNRLLAFCIPLFLLVGIWSVMILPAMLPAGSEDFSQEGEMLDAGAGSLGTVIPYDGVRIEILDLQDDVFREYSDISNVERFYSLIRSYFFSNEIKDESTDQNQESEAGQVPEHEEVTDSNKELRCRIVFTSSDGKEKSYLLYRNTITDEQTGQKEILNENEFNRLKPFLNGN